MAVIVCTYPDNCDPLTLAKQFQKLLLPIVVELDNTDEYENSIAKLEAALDNSGHEKSLFAPLASMKRNAAEYGPLYKFSIRISDYSSMNGAFNRKGFNVVCKDPINPFILDMLTRFAQGIPKATIAAEDNLGNPLPIREM